jgi:hypothetical protein
MWDILILDFLAPGQMNRQAKEPLSIALGMAHIETSLTFFKF